MEQCELRIKNLAEKCGYCVAVEVTADYSQPVAGVPANVQQLVPYKIKIEWIADKGPKDACRRAQNCGNIQPPKRKSSMHIERDVHITCGDV